MSGTEPKSQVPLANSTLNKQPLILTAQYLRL
jgi:hypothetical protein